MVAGRDNYNRSTKENDVAIAGRARQLRINTTFRIQKRKTN